MSSSSHYILDNKHRQTSGSSASEVHDINGRSDKCGKQGSTDFESDLDKELNVRLDSDKHWRYSSLPCLNYMSESTVRDIMASVLFGIRILEGHFSQESIPSSLFTESPQKLSSVNSFIEELDRSAKQLKQAVHSNKTMKTSPTVSSGELSDNFGTVVSQFQGNSRITNDDEEGRSHELISTPQMCVQIPDVTIPEKYADMVVPPVEYIIELLLSSSPTREETLQMNHLANAGDDTDMLRTAQDSGLVNQTEDLITKPYQNLNSDRNFPKCIPHRQELKLQAPKTDRPVQIPPQTQFTTAVEKREPTETEWCLTRFREREYTSRTESPTQGQNPAPPPLTPDRLRACMVNRVWRIASMVHLTSFPVASVVMADAGWYYDEDTDEMCCYCCCLRIRRSQWDRDDNPAHIHAMGSPNCPHINPNITRVPLETVAEIQSENETVEKSDSGAEETIASDTDTEPSQRNLNLNVLVAAPETAEQPVFEGNLGIAETNHHHESLAGTSSRPPNSGFESCSRQSRNPDVLWTPVCCTANSKDERGRRPNAEPATDLQEDGENVDVERSRDGTDSGAESEVC